MEYYCCTRDYTKGRSFQLWNSIVVREITTKAKSMTKCNRIIVEREKAKRSFVQENGDSQIKDYKTN
ncbi:MAG TPA: hypothetical protein VGO09_10725 [Flavisolibacter sp.]|nr:hypothetical protein [Flavisolibacter sp.]